MSGLHGPSVTGTGGRTIGCGFQQEGVLTDDIGRRECGIRGRTPAEDGSLTFWWRFAEESHGTRVTYRIAAEGPRIAEYQYVFRGIEAHALNALRALANHFANLAKGSP